MSTAERTDPKLWEEVKDELKASAKGGEEGEWSARKAQLAVQEYKKRGGGYKGQKSKQNDLKKWTDEDWGTKSGERSQDTGERYLPKSAREDLSDEEYRRTSQKKRADKAKGKQFSNQPSDIAAKTAKHRDRDTQNADGPTKKALQDEARELDIDGRSAMTKDDLEDAVASAKERREHRSTLTKADLSTAAKALGVTGISSMSKEGLVEAVRRAAADGADNATKADLEEAANAVGITGRSSMRKNELRHAIADALR